jgi:hypothetical protein
VFPERVEPIEEAGGVSGDHRCEARNACRAGRQGSFTREQG